MSQHIAIIPGSFSPLHHGHLAIADWADKRAYTVVFEVSRLRFDKNAYSDEELNNITKQFDIISRNYVVTNCISFVEKSIQFKNSAFRKINNLPVLGVDISFLVGYDTAERICDPKYYFGSTTERDRCLLLMRNLGVKYIVFERNGKKDISHFPKDFLEMSSVACNYTSFNISSTQIRENSKKRIVCGKDIQLIYLMRGDRFVLSDNDELEYELCSHNTDNGMITARFGEEFIKMDNRSFVRKVTYV